MPLKEKIQQEKPWVELLNKVVNHAVVPRKQVCDVIAGFEVEQD